MVLVAFAFSLFVPRSILSVICLCSRSAHAWCVWFEYSVCLECNFLFFLLFAFCWFDLPFLIILCSWSLRSAPCCRVYLPQFGLIHLHERCNLLTDLFFVLTDCFEACMPDRPHLRFASTAFFMTLCSGCRTFVPKPAGHEQSAHRAVGDFYCSFFA